MERNEIVKCLQEEIKECDEYLQNEPAECWGYDEVCIIYETRKEMCEHFICMLREGS